MHGWGEPPSGWDLGSKSALRLRQFSMRGAPDASPAETRLHGVESAARCNDAAWLKAFIRPAGVSQTSLHGHLLDLCKRRARSDRENGAKLSAFLTSTKHQSRRPDSKASADLAALSAASALRRLRVPRLARAGGLGAWAGAGMCGCRLHRSPRLARIQDPSGSRLTILCVEAKVLLRSFHVSSHEPTDQLAAKQRACVFSSRLGKIRINCINDKPALCQSREYREETKPPVSESGRKSRLSADASPNATRSTPKASLSSSKVVPRTPLRFTSPSSCVTASRFRNRNTW